MAIIARSSADVRLCPRPLMGQNRKYRSFQAKSALPSRTDIIGPSAMSVRARKRLGSSTECACQRTRNARARDDVSFKLRWQPRPASPIISSQYQTKAPRGCLQSVGRFRFVTVIGRRRRRLTLRLRAKFRPRLRVGVRFVNDLELHSIRMGVECRISGLVGIVCRSVQDRCASREHGGVNGHSTLFSKIPNNQGTLSFLLPPIL